MYPLEALYPFALAGVNMAMGWLLYRLSEPIVGGLLVMIGLVVMLTVVGRTVSEHRPAVEESI